MSDPIEAQDQKNGETPGAEVSKPNVAPRQPNGGGIVFRIIMGFVYTICFFMGVGALFAVYLFYYMYLAQEKCADSLFTLDATADAVLIERMKETDWSFMKSTMERESHEKIVATSPYMLFGNYKHWEKVSRTLQFLPGWFGRQQYSEATVRFVLQTTAGYHIFEYTLDQCLALRETVSGAGPFEDLGPEYK
jgi:hypothetical protein